MTTKEEKTYIGLDVGEKRIGVARIHTLAMISEPLKAIETSKQDPIGAISEVVAEYSADGIVVGLPRGLDGQETSQTNYCQNFALELASKQRIPVYMIDEAGTSKAADERIGANTEISRDSMAAAILLEDFAEYPDKRLLLVNS